LIKVKNESGTLYIFKCLGSGQEPGWLWAPAGWFVSNLAELYSLEVFWNFSVFDAGWNFLVLKTKQYFVPSDNLVVLRRIDSWQSCENCELRDFKEAILVVHKHSDHGDIKL
jgi:hypothetical protein